ncbi:glycosyltransferase [Actinomycetospora sp. C-140]
MRFLVSACPLRGHVNTVVPLARAAAAGGHEVVVATGLDRVGDAAAHGLETWPVGLTYAAAGGVPRTPDDFVRAAHARAADLVPRAERWRPDVVVHEETELAGAVAAARSGARQVVHGLGLMPEVWTWEAFRGGLEGLGEAWGVAGVADASRRATYVEPCPPALRSAGERVWADTLPIRPVFGAPVPGDRLPPDVVALSGRPVVHLTLGTVFHEATAVLDVALAGLTSCDVAVVVTVGPDGDPERVPASPSVVVHRYLPHALLLPRCALVVSHAGSGAVFGACAHGLPQLLLPQGVDQFGNAEGARRAGTALVLEPPDVTADAVAGAARRLLTDPAYAAAAGAVRDEIAGMPAGDAVVAALARTTVRAR